MNECQYCGKEIDAFASVCPYCRVALITSNEAYEPESVETEDYQESETVSATPKNIFTILGYIYLVIAVIAAIGYAAAISFLGGIVVLAGASPVAIIILGIGKILEKLDG